MDAALHENAFVREIERELGPDYRVEAILGSGAAATVWRGVDLRDGQQVAIKRIQIGKDDARGFLHELRLLSSLRHPRIVGIRDFVEGDQGARYLVLEYCSGGNLRTWLHDADAVDVRTACGLARDIALGLAALHEAGFVHRDLKPDNVLFGASATDGPKLADFGLTRFAESPRRASLRSLSGTPAYMAPEQFGNDYGPASDVYALGVVLYELLHGRPPFDGEVRDVIHAHLHATPELRADLPPELRRLIERMLAKDPGERPVHAGQLAEALSRHCEGPVEVRGVARPDWTRTLAGEPLAVHGMSRRRIAIVFEDRVVVLEHDGREVGEWPCVQAVASRQDRHGRLWIAHAAGLSRSDDGLSFDRVPRISFRARDFAIDDRADPTRIAVVEDDRVRVVGGGRSAMTVPTGAGGLPPRLAFTDQGALVMARGSVRAELVAIDGPDRGVRLELPGPCLALHADPRSGTRVIAEVLADGRSRLCDVDLRCRRVFELTTGDAPPLAVHVGRRRHHVFDTDGNLAEVGRCTTRVVDRFPVPVGRVVGISVCTDRLTAVSCTSSGTVVEAFARNRNATTI